MATETHLNIQLQYVGVGNGELEGLDKTEAYMLHFLAIWNVSELSSDIYLRNIIDYKVHFKHHSNNSLDSTFSS